MEHPQVALPELPTEVWNKILIYLQAQDLHICRLVCKQWTDLVDSLDDLKIWSCYFAKSRHAHAFSTFLWKSDGTRFSTSAEIEQFMADSKQSGNLSKNSFHKHTLIVHWCSTAQYTGVCTKFPELVQSHGDYIRHLVYFVHPDVTASVTNIPLIFQIQNLHSLTIYCDNWSKIGHIFNLLERNTFPVAELKCFQNLNLFGNHSKYALPYFFTKHGSQLKRLNIWCPDITFRTNTVPNLEELKIWDIQLAKFRQLCGSVKLASLKRLSIKLVDIEINDNGYFSEKVDIGMVFRKLEKFAETLESLHLQVSEEHIEKKVGLDNRSLPNVTDLRVPFYFLCGTESPPNRPILPVADLGKIFPKLEHLLLVDSRDPIEDWTSYERMLEQTLESFWKLLAAEVKDLTVRYHRKSTSGNRLVCNFRKTRVQFEAAANNEQD